MKTAIQPMILSQSEAEAYMGGGTIWTEMEAVYGDTHLRPFRTLSSGKTSWHIEVLEKVSRLAQAEQTLSDRDRVEAALARRRKQKEAHAKSLQSA